MLDRIIEILKRLAKSGELEYDIIDLLAQEIHALRYEIAKEPYTEWIEARSTEWGIDEDYLVWLSSQGEE
jgi:Trm5-related predicted tRNA methylase